MKPSPLSRFARVAIVVGVVLRLVLMALNGEANDDHMPVIRTIAFEHRFPTVHEQWESFQPKLYHTTVAMVLRIFDVQTTAIQIRIAQLIGCLAGLATLAIAVRFFRRSTLSSRAQTGAIAFVSLNPALIGINAQATNDSFVILFGTLALTYGMAFFRDYRTRDFWVMAAACLAAGLTKGNGLVTIVACLLVLAATWVLPNATEPGRDRSQMRRLTLTFAAMVLPLVWFLTPLDTNLRDEGTPFVTNWAKLPPAPLGPIDPEMAQFYYSKATSNSFRPGVLSVASALLTFRFGDLMDNPFNNHAAEIFPAHRTSLWTQLYAHTFYLHFDTMPKSWRSVTPLAQNLGRVQLVLGLVPAALLLLGLGGTTARAWTWIRHRTPDRPFDAATTLLRLTAWGYLAFLVAYVLHVRDFSTMKAIFVFPAIVAFTFLAASQYDSLVAGRPMIDRLVRGVTGVLLLGFVVDITWIIRQLLDQMVGRALG